MNKIYLTIACFLLLFSCKNEKEYAYMIEKVYKRNKADYTQLINLSNQLYSQDSIRYITILADKIAEVNMINGNSNIHIWEESKYKDLNYRSNEELQTLLIIMRRNMMSTFICDSDSSIYIKYKNIPGLRLNYICQSCKYAPEGNNKHNLVKRFDMRNSKHWAYKLNNNWIIVFHKISI